MAPYFMLFEHAVGYIKYQVVYLLGFLPFETVGDAVANINSVSEGIVHNGLEVFRSR